MLQSSVLTLLLAATASYFPVQIAAAPTTNEAAAPALVLRNIKFSEGGQLERRGVPQACQFPLGRENDFYYSDQSEYTGHATCVGWIGTIGCGPWSQQEVSDGMSCMSQQLTKDGQLQGTTVGKWTATFGLLTTAFSYTNPVNFDHVFETSQTSDDKTMHGANSWYYMDQGNFIEMDALTCG